jgi:hypothetical protein
VDTLIGSGVSRNGRFLGPIKDMILIFGSSSPSETGTIGMELTPKGLCHLFHLSMHEITNRMVSFEVLVGPQGASLQQIVGDAEDPKEKLCFFRLP